MVMDVIEWRADSTRARSTTTSARYRRSCYLRAVVQADSGSGGGPPVEPPRARQAPHLHPVLLVYQPPANSTFLSEQTSHQPALFFSQNKPASSNHPAVQQTNISHQPPATSQTNMLLISIGNIGTTTLTLFMVHLGECR
jgi:hypothetical protein